MRSLKITISGIKTHDVQDIEWEQYEETDLIAKAITETITPEYLKILLKEGRIIIRKETDNITEYEYQYS